MDYKKYKKYEKIEMLNREWPDKEILKAPRWCSVDLRDGNQSLPKPMSVEEKIKMFKLLVDIGFKEIEVGFPSASETEYEFVRSLIEKDLIPEDVVIQVLTQSREHLIKRTFESLKGCKKAIVHLYNSTSTLQRKVVFNKSMEEIIEIAVKGATLLKEESKNYPDTEFIFEYSPESFTGTEIEYSIEICEKVMEVLKPTPENKIIINLPSTVEMSTPNIYADLIEYFCKNVKNRDSIILSLHTHNDRGTSTAASELGLLAGADRLEGTLFGNGERTGNLDIVNTALNLYSQGINPNLDFTNINEIIEIYKECSNLGIHERHPYVGELVYCAFSGSHQDAIRKGMIAKDKEKQKHWEVPYLPIDPKDLGREYKEIIRINSQSGKGGAVYIMENNFTFSIPKKMHEDFGKVIKSETDRMGKELDSKDILKIFKKEYVGTTKPYKLNTHTIKSISTKNKEQSLVQIDANIEVDKKQIKISSIGNGPVDAFNNAIQKSLDIKYKFKSYWEHALSEGSHSKGVAYVEVEVDGSSYFGVGISENINTAAIEALINAINKSYIGKGEIEYVNDNDSKDIIKSC